MVVYVLMQDERILGVFAQRGDAMNHASALKLKYYLIQTENVQ
jgi:hypothetical protein